MSYPTRASLRSINVNGVKYHWRFSSGDRQSELVVYGPISGRQALAVSLLGWRDGWLTFPEPVNNVPEVIKPSFVRESIEFGLANGWQPEKAGDPMRFEWSGSQFSTAQ